MLQGKQFDPNLFVEEGERDESDFFEPDPTSGADEGFSRGKVAMILPSKRTGLVADAAKALRLGFQHAAEVENDRIELAVYSTDGTLEDVLPSYDHAVASGAGLVVGPMLKNSVRGLLQARHSSKVTTIVTQQVDVFGFDDSAFFGISIGYEAEAKMIARTALEAGLVSGAIIVADATPLADRVADSFAREWERLTNTSPRRVPAVTQEQLVEMHDTLKEVAKASVEAQSAYWPLVFAAGDREFVLRVRAHTPGLLSLHALSLVNDRGRAQRSEDPTSLGLDNVHVVEMPWMIAPNSVLPTRYVREDIRSWPPIEQRFFALGIDIYRLSAQRICWEIGCSTDGVSGTWSIVEGEHNFLRTGTPARYAEGALKLPGS